MSRPTLGYPLHLADLNKAIGDRVLTIAGSDSIAVQRTDDAVTLSVKSTTSRTPLGTIFRVNLSNTGGSNGTKSTTASWVYTAKGLDGVSLGTSLSPEKTRPNGTRSAATKGSGYYNTSNTFVLWDADEPFGIGGC